MLKLDPQRDEQQGTSRSEETWAAIFSVLVWMNDKACVAGEVTGAEIYTSAREVGSVDSVLSLMAWGHWPFTQQISGGGVIPGLTGGERSIRSNSAPVVETLHTSKPLPPHWKQWRKSTRVCLLQGPELYHVWELGHSWAVSILVALQLLTAGSASAASHLVLPHCSNSCQSLAEGQGESPVVGGCVCVCVSSTYWGNISAHT